MRVHLKGDERILGDSDFVQEILNTANENMEKQYGLRAKGYDFNKILERVGSLFGLTPENLLIPSKQRDRVKARSLICYWAVKKIGISSLSVAVKLGIKQPSVSRAAIRGEKIALKGNFHLEARKKS